MWFVLCFREHGIETPFNQIQDCEDDCDDLDQDRRIFEVVGVHFGRWLASCYLVDLVVDF